MSIVLLGSTSGSCTLQEQAVAGTTTLTLPTFNGTVGLLVSGTAVASTSGTSIDFTSIPAGVRRITLTLSGVSTNGTSPPLIQIGSTTYATSGYLGANSVLGSAVVTVNFTTGFGIGVNTTQWSASQTISGTLILSLHNGNTWSCNGIVGTSNVANQYLTSGSSGTAITSTLDRVRLTTSNGTDTFDAGSINILYE